MKAILGKKVGMTQIFTEEGNVVPVTVVEAGPCVVVAKKTIESDGYNAIQVGFGEVKQSRVNKPKTGHFKKAGVEVKKVLRELRTDDVASFEIGQAIKADIFENGDIIDVTGTIKGKGYAGAIKRYGQHRGPMAHGSKYHRGHGSMGTRVAKVYKGHHMPGHLGNVQRTIQNLKVMGVDAERNMLLIRGSIPGANGQIVTVKKAVKA